MTRLCACSPVDTGMGAISRRMRACPRISSGLVGSSIQAISNSARRFSPDVASSTSQRWLASMAIATSSPTARRARRQRAAPDVVVRLRPRLERDGAEALLARLLGQRHELLVRVAEPARGGCVGRVATSLHLGNPAGLAVLRLAQQAERFLLGEG